MFRGNNDRCPAGFVWCEEMTRARKLQRAMLNVTSF